VKGLQGGLATHIIAAPIYDASYKTFKWMDLGLAATDAGVCHGSLLHHGDMFPQSFYCQ
jgi:hypothetical protein